MHKAIFEKPDIPELKNQGYQCIDMHCHSRYSDGLTKIRDVYKKCKKMGIGVALTDHNEAKGAVEISKYRDIKTIPGIETTSSEGIHTLFYFYSAKELQEFHKKVVEKNRSKQNPFSDLALSIIDIIEKSSRYNCRICAAHPFGPWNTGLHKFTKKKEYMKLLRKIDFVEAINSSTFHDANIKAVEWGSRIKKAFTGGSDSHASVFIGKVITASERKDFLDSIMKESLVIGKEVNPMLLSLRHLLKIRHFARFPKFYIRKVLSYRAK
jgi:predicted metal-dependent phosphoesterase TrpH